MSLQPKPGYLQQFHPWDIVDLDKIVIGGIWVKWMRKSFNLFTTITSVS